MDYTVLVTPHTRLPPLRLDFRFRFVHRSLRVSVVTRSRSSAHCYGYGWFFHAAFCTVRWFTYRSSHLPRLPRGLQFLRFTRAPCLHYYTYIRFYRSVSYRLVLCRWFTAVRVTHFTTPRSSYIPVIRCRSFTVTRFWLVVYGYGWVLCPTAHTRLPAPLRFTTPGRFTVTARLHFGSGLPRGCALPRRIRRCLVRDFLRLRLRLPVAAHALPVLGLRLRTVHTAVRYHALRWFCIPARYTCYVHYVAVTYLPVLYRFFTVLRSGSRLHLVRSSHVPLHGYCTRLHTVYLRLRFDAFTVVFSLRFWVPLHHGSTAFCTHTVRHTRLRLYTHTRVTVLTPRLLPHTVRLRLVTTLPVLPHYYLRYIHAGYHILLYHRVLLHYATYGRVLVRLLLRYRCVRWITARVHSAVGSYALPTVLPVAVTAVLTRVTLRLRYAYTRTYYGSLPVPVTCDSFDSPLLRAIVYGLRLRFNGCVTPRAYRTPRARFATVVYTAHTTHFAAHCPFYPILRCIHGWLHTHFGCSRFLLLYILPYRLPVIPVGSYICRSVADWFWFFHVTFCRLPRLPTTTVHGSYLPLVTVRLPRSTIWFTCVTYSWFIPIRVPCGLVHCRVLRLLHFVPVILHWLPFGYTTYIPLLVAGCRSHRAHAVLFVPHHLLPVICWFVYRLPV